jgi:uncharacterized protein YkwD
VQAVRLRGLRACTLAAAIVCIVVTPAAAACEGADQAPAEGTTGPALLPAVVATVCEINAARAANGVAAVRLEQRLTQAAYGHALDMTTQKFFAHASSDGRQVGTRLTAAGYGAGAADWAAGETLGWGDGTLSSPHAIVDAWLGSPEHRPIVLDPRFRDVGVMVVAEAPVAGAMGTTYVADFGFETAAATASAATKPKRRCRRLSRRARARLRARRRTSTHVRCGASSRSRAAATAPQG